MKTTIHVCTKDVPYNRKIHGDTAKHPDFETVSIPFGNMWGTRRCRYCRIEWDFLYGPKNRPL